MLPDTALARLVAAGNSRAFEVLYERYRDDLYRYSLSILRHAQDAEEALQQAMMNAYKALSSGTRDLAVRPWLYRIVHNSAISLIRARPVAVSLTGMDPVLPTSVAEEVETREEIAQLRKDIFALPERQRSALVLRELAGLSYIAIAEAMAVAADDARRLVFEARQSLGEFAAGRELACGEAQATLAGGDGRALRGRKLSAHLRDCDSCRAFYAAQKSMSGKLALVFPILPALAAKQTLAALGLGVAGGASAAAGGATAGAIVANPAPPVAVGLGVAATVAAVAVALVIVLTDGPFVADASAPTPAVASAVFL
jgi:RNA polymerase sigma factor (sigma-70 family)